MPAFRLPKSISSILSFFRERGSIFVSILNHNVCFHSVKNKDPLKKKPPAYGKGDAGGQLKRFTSSDSRLCDCFPYVNDSWHVTPLFLFCQLRHRTCCLGSLLRRCRKVVHQRCGRDYEQTCDKRAPS